MGEGGGGDCVHVCVCTQCLSLRGGRWVFVFVLCVCMGVCGVGGGCVCMCGGCVQGSMHQNFPYLME